MNNPYFFHSPSVYMKGADPTSSLIGPEKHYGIKGMGGPFMTMLDYARLT